MLTQMPKVGDKVRYIGKDQHGISHGDIFEIKDSEFRGTFFTDNDGFTREIIKKRYPEWELVEQPTPVEASPTVIDLLANLSRRVYELERENKTQAYEINELYKALAEVSR